ncbi:hypothetical protein CLOSTASPAR_03043, partial [[Clostridium] asparagiforme DSM 15981]
MVPCTIIAFAIVLFLPFQMISARQNPLKFPDENFIVLMQPDADAVIGVIQPPVIGAGADQNAPLQKRFIQPAPRGPVRPGRIAEKNVVGLRAVHRKSKAGQ